MLNLLTFLLLHHDGVAEREQLEKLQDVRVASRADEGDEMTVAELELSVDVLVPAEVDRLHREESNSHESQKYIKKVVTSYGHLVETFKLGACSRKGMRCSVHVDGPGRPHLYWLDFLQSRQTEPCYCKKLI